MHLWLNEGETVFDSFVLLKISKICKNLKDMYMYIYQDTHYQNYKYIKYIKFNKYIKYIKYNQSIFFLELSVMFYTDLWKNGFSHLSNLKSRTFNSYQYKYRY